jgi:hypothetical protein
MLENIIHEYYQREWIIHEFLPLTNIPLTHQRITSLGEALEQAMNIEAMAGYPERLIIMRPLEDENISQLQGQISKLSEKIQELTPPREIRPQVWCIGCYIKGHIVTECLIMRGVGPSSNFMAPPLVGPSRGVA